MNCNPLLQPIPSLQAAIAAGLLTLVGLPAQALPAAPRPATTGPSASPALVSNRPLNFRVSGVRPSANRIGGISRGPGRLCSTDLQTEVRLQPLVLPSEMTVSSDNGKIIETEPTTLEQPTIFIYIPPNTAQTSELSILEIEEPSADDLASGRLPNEQEVYRATFNQPLEGLVGITLPPLTEGKLYHWVMQLVCVPEDRSGDARVDGLLERQPLPPDLSDRLAQTPVGQLLEVYASAGLLQDALNRVASLRRQSPTEPGLQSAWNRLLEAIELESLASEPVQMVPAVFEPMQP